MNFFRAILYFLREASVNLLRSWKISVLAVATIAVSLFLGGFVLLLSLNGSRLIDRWKSEAKIVVYLAPGREPEDLPEIRDLAVRAPWTEEVEAVTTEEAARRFRRSFPSVEDLIEDWEQEPLPASFEIAFDLQRIREPEYGEWLQSLEGRPGVVAVDDDRDWVRQLETALRIVTGIGLLVGTILIGAAVFTIASVIRLTAHLYREEIAVMRLVGATEFFIRGPFYLEGLIQGTLGGLTALAALYLAYGGLSPEGARSFLGGILWSRFLPPIHQIGLVGLGAFAGLFGALISLRKEEI